MANEITVKPLVDILSKQLGEQVVMSGESYVYFAGFLPVDQADVDVALLEQSIVVAEKITVVTMRQARLALLQMNLLTTVTDAINNSTDEALKIEWEYATEIRRDWQSLIDLTASLGMSASELDDIFLLASSL